MMAWRRLKAHSRDAQRTDSGAASIEMAMVTPLLLLLALGAGDFGRIWYAGITLSHAARAGAAYGAQSSGHAGDGPGIELAAQSEAQDIPPIVVTSQPVCECPGGGAVSCTLVSCGGGYGAPQAFVEVTVTLTFTTVAPFPGVPDTVPLSRTAKLRLQYRIARRALTTRSSTNEYPRSGRIRSALA